MLNFYDHYEAIIYNLQHKIYYLLSSEVNALSALIFILIFFSGILTSLTPCFLSILPLIISYINIDSHYKQNINKNIFIFGLITSLLIILLLVNFISYKYYAYIISIPVLSSFILILLSFNLMQILDFSYFFSFINKNLNKINTDNILLKSYLLGFIVGFSIFPCSTSILLVFVFWVNHSTNLFILLFYWIIYLLGCILPFILIVNIAFTYIKSNIIFSIWRFIIPFSGSIILFFSLFSFLEKVFI
uniref:Thiol:disulfide interchange protein n=1 Tax=Acrosorium ciliolatum TaxID=1550622 RepID=A0A1Z1M2B1_9FLOR|nr:thiol:disulfide interchange protein [Acrosorium ciliolatum]ARW59924.1 thiol:disulfide interchange protein [Acrosorium ciliolatum]